MQIFIAVHTLQFFIQIKTVAPDAAASQ